MGEPTLQAEGADVMPNGWRVFAQWLAYVVLILAASAAMLLGKADAVLVDRVRVQFADVLAPALDTLSRSLDRATDAAAAVHRWFALAEENDSLRREREELLQWQAVAQRLGTENDELKHLLNLVVEPQARFVTARVVADPSGAFAHSLLVYAGVRDGVDKGQIVVSGEGLVGRVAAAASRVARVLLISDLNSRVPVLVGAGQARAILAGDNSGRPKLIHLDPGVTVLPGDRVVTSGVTDAFPPGLPVGVVVAVDDRDIRVAPFVQQGQLEYVRVVDHGLPDLVHDLSPKRPGGPAPAVASAGRQ